MSNEGVTPLDQLVGLEALKGQLLTAGTDFKPGHEGSGYLGNLQDGQPAFCTDEALQKGDYVLVENVMRNGDRVFVTKVDTPVQSMTEMFLELNQRVNRLEISDEATKGAVFQNTQEIEWVKDRLPGA